MTKNVDKHGDSTNPKTTLPRAKTFANTLEGEVVDLDLYTNTDLVITGIADRRGEHGDFILVQFAKEYPPEHLMVASTGAVAVMETLKRAREQGGFPIVGAIRKVKNYLVIE